LKRVLAPFLFAAVASAAFASVPAVTPAWGVLGNVLSFNDRGVQVVVDSLLNSYYLVDTNHGSYEQWSVYKRDPYGQPIRTYTITPPLGSNAVDLAVDGAFNVYVLGSYKLSTGRTVRIYCFDANGHQKWASEFSGGANSTSFAVALSADSSGNVYAVGDMGNPVHHATRLLKYDSGGNLIYARQYDNFNPLRVEFDDAHNFWIAGQYHPGNNGTGGFWGEFNGQTGLPIRQHALVDSTAGATDYFYSFAVTPTSNGSYYLAQNTRTQTASSSKMDSTISFFDPSNALVWRSHAFSGPVERIAATSPNDVYGISGTAFNTGPYVERVNAGTVVWQKPSFSNHIAANGSAGVFIARQNTSSGDLRICELEAATGGEAWSYTLFDVSQHAPSLGDMKLVSGSLFTAATAFHSSTNYDGDLRRFVQGPALSGLTAPGITQPGASYSVTITLNLPAPAGGLYVTLISDDPHTVFSNNTTTQQFLVPQGSKTKTAQVQITSSSTATSIGIQARGQGVVRQARTKVGRF
jgi:hypothetical protein